MNFQPVNPAIYINHSIKMAMRRCLISILCLLWGLFSSAQSSSRPDSLKVYTVRQLRADFVYFMSALQTAHPSLYRYQTKDSVEAYFMDGLSKIDHPMGDIEFWVLLQHIVTKIGSGHTEITPRDEFAGEFNYRLHNALPFFIYIRNNRVYVKNFIRYTDTALRMGDEVLSINNHAAFDLLLQARELIAGDGYSNSFKDYQLEGVRFNWIYNLLYGDQPQFDLAFTSGNVTKTKVIKAVALRYSQPGSSPGIKPPGSTHRFSIAADDDSASHKVSYPPEIPNSALLKLANFTYDDYAAFHKKLFKELKRKNINKLIIDLRNNTGGYDDRCIDLMKYFMDKDFYFTKLNEGVTDVKTLVSLTENIARTKPAYIDFSAIPHKLYQIKSPENQLQHPNGTFTGNIYLLINRGTFSAASIMATAIKEQTRCTTIGEETGGGRAGCDGGTVADIVLPNTGFILSVPLMWTYSLTQQPNYGDGLKPDVDFTPGAWDIYNELYKNINPFIRIINMVASKDK